MALHLKHAHLTHLIVVIAEQMSGAAMYELVSLYNMISASLLIFQ
jgi:hypothetical protein